MSQETHQRRPADMSNTSRTSPGELRRKRVRKGTRSCWECKRRKVKCVYPSEDHSTCAGCLDKGTTCLSQEFIDVPPPRDAGTSALDQRVGRVEELLEKMMEKASNSPDEDRATYNPGGVLASSTSVSISAYDMQPQSRSPFGRHAEDGLETNTYMTLPNSDSVLNSTPLDTVAHGRPLGRIEKLRQQLAAMLPCQEDVDCLADSSYGWWLIQRHMLPNLLRIPEEDLRKPFDVSIVSASHPMIIARLLLCVALCIQQLPPDFDPRRLHIKGSLREMMERNVTTAAATVTCDDELTGSMEGIECFSLQGLYEGVAGNFRRAWLSFRKAINVAHLLGVHRVSLKYSQDGEDLTETRRHYMWYHLIQEERYLSLILGVPSATGSTPFPLDDQAPCISQEDLYHKQLCEISGFILARNQGDPTRTFSATQEIDDKLDSIAKRMPPGWWEIPTSRAEGKTDESYAEYERIYCHIWHFELETLVHLPFMLRSATDRRYEYSRLACLKASRNLILRWMFLRSAYGQTLFNNLLEFQAFTASITLLLGLLGSTYTTTDPMALKERENDLQLVETLAQILEGMKQYGGGVHVVNQSISVIRTLQGILRGGDSSVSLRLAIPYFGTISVARGGAVQSLEGERLLGANPRSQAPSRANHQLDYSRSTSAQPTSITISTWQSAPTPNAQTYSGIGVNEKNMNDSSTWPQDTVLQFTSTHFPTLDAQVMNSPAGGSFVDSEMLFFDSLLNTDLAGNWSL